MFLNPSHTVMVAYNRSRMKEHFKLGKETSQEILFCTAEHTQLNIKIASLLDRKVHYGFFFGGGGSFHESVKGPTNLPSL